MLATLGRSIKRVVTFLSASQFLHSTLTENFWHVFFLFSYQNIPGNPHLAHLNSYILMLYTDHVKYSERITRRYNIRWNGPRIDFLKVFETLITYLITFVNTWYLDPVSVSRWSLLCRASIRGGGPNHQWKWHGKLYQASNLWLLRRQWGVIRTVLPRPRYLGCRWVTSLVFLTRNEMQQNKANHPSAILKAIYRYTFL